MVDIRGQLSGKVVVFTGAASGIGLSAVRRFVREGARVVAVDLSPTVEVNRPGFPGVSKKRGAIHWDTKAGCIDVKFRSPRLRGDDRVTSQYSLDALRPRIAR